VIAVPAKWKIRSLAKQITGFYPYVEVWALGSSGDYPNIDKISP
jgi:hypothetical protein